MWSPRWPDRALCSTPGRAFRLISVDQNLRRFGLRLLLDRDLEYAVLVAGRDPLVAGVVGQFERPLNLSVAAFCNTNRCLLWPFRSRTFRRDHQLTVLNPRVDRLILESRHLEVEMVCIVVLNHVDRRHHVSGGSIRLPEPTYRAGIKQPAPP